MRRLSLRITRHHQGKCLKTDGDKSWLNETWLHVSDEQLRLKEDHPLNYGGRLYHSVSQNSLLEPFLSYTLVFWKTLIIARPINVINYVDDESTITSGKVWGHTPEQRVAASTLWRYSFGLRRSTVTMWKSKKHKNIDTWICNLNIWLLFILRPPLNLLSFIYFD